MMKYVIGINPSDCLEYAARANIAANLGSVKKTYSEWVISTYSIPNSKYGRKYAKHTNATTYPEYVIRANAIRHQWADQWVSQWDSFTDDLRHITSRRPF
jgi:hypothetical protein